MKLTVLGKYGPYPRAGGATSGYLLAEGRTNLLVECGSGILSRLQQCIPLGEISGIVLSHLHSDHIADMFILRYALQILQQRGEAKNVPIKVFAPAQPAYDLQALRASGMFEFLTMETGLHVRLGDFDLDFSEMTHPVPSYAVRFTGESSVLAYTGDTNWNDEIVPFVEGADLLLADCGLLKKEKTGPAVPHLTADEVGRIAVQSGVRRLICTHINPRHDEAEVLAQAQAHFAGAVLAKEMHSYEI